MNAMEYQDEELRQLFRQIPVENPSGDFSSRVMERVIQETRRVEKRQRIFRFFGWVAAGCLAVLVLVSGLLFAHYYYDLSGIRNIFNPLLASLGENLSFTSSFLAELFRGKTILIGIVFLTLLLGDLFIRHAVEQKRAMK